MAREQKIVMVKGGVSQLLPGDPDKGKYGAQALPQLLAEGWQVKDQSKYADGEGWIYYTLERPTGAVIADLE